MSSLSFTDFFAGI